MNKLIIILISISYLFSKFDCIEILELNICFWALQFDLFDLYIEKNEIRNIFEND